jgi:hypothetical protein
VDHVPEPPDLSRHAPRELVHTQDAIRKAGYEPDSMLWLAPTDTSLFLVGADCEHSGPQDDSQCTGSPYSVSCNSPGSYRGRHDRVEQSGRRRLAGAT